MKTDFIHHRDALEFLRALPTASLDLAVIDPPYNLAKADWDTFTDHAAFLAFTFEWLDALLPALKPGA